MLRLPRRGVVLLALFGLLAGCGPKQNRRAEPFDTSGLSDPVASSVFAQHQEFRTRFEQGWSALESGALTQARRAFRDLLTLPPSGVSRSGLYPVYVGLGYVGLAEGNLQEAERQLREAQRLAPAGYPAALEGLALVYEARGEHLAALELLQQAAGDGPLPPGLQLRADIIKLRATEEMMADARSLQARGELEPAVDAYSQVLAIAPQRLEAHQELARLHEQSGRLELAVESYREAALLAPRDPDNWVRLASALARLGRTDDARSAVERALELPGGEAAARGLARQLREQARSAGADSPQLLRVLDTAQLDRGGLAALVVTRLPVLERALKPNRPPRVITDIYNSWARDYVQEVVALGLMEVYDNHTFRPNQPVQRQDLARAAARVLTLMRESGWLSEVPYPQLRIRDVPEFHLLHADIMDVLRYELMQLDELGRFDPERLVSGQEAVEVVDRLAALVR